MNKVSGVGKEEGEKVRTMATQYLAPAFPPSPAPAVLPHAAALSGVTSDISHFYKLSALPSHT